MPQDIIDRIKANRRRATQMAALRRKGKSFREIGLRFKVSKQFVQAELRRMRG